jgi:arginase
VRVVGPERDPDSGIVGWPSLGEAVGGIRAGTREVLRAGYRPLLLGGCCAMLIGAVPALRDEQGRVGLVNVDGHLDVYDNRTSPTGEAADFPVTALLGIGWQPLLERTAPVPVLRGTDVTALGARDLDEVADVGDLAERLGVRVHPPHTVTPDPAGAGVSTRDSFAARGVPYWLHLDVDVLDEDAFPATDYLMPGGLQTAELTALLAPLARSPWCAGMSVGCYNPSKDDGDRYGRELADVLVRALVPGA